ncbi:hypothetical protein [Streptomyces sp. NBC_00564]|uniref:hypothetical protein n=1 Tax=unclassified Streptomyces TaxID=2593676 RepID=UPI002FCD9E2C|nr:hypothetical protein OG256_44965 [Streptomyces sp. NBC_00564]WUC46989.1 hypothetical protein OG266_00440 [Streptomyces sp. NBC_00554]
MAAVSGAGEILHDGFDADLLRALLKLAEQGRGVYGDDLMQRLAVEAIARSLGAGHTESMRPPEGVTRSESAQGLLRVARDRLHTQPLPDRGLCAQREIGVGWTG